MEWMILPLRRYADFEGRSRRLEYWMFTLFTWLVVGLWFGAAIGLGLFTGDFEESGTRELAPFWWPLFGVLAVGYLAILVPSIAVTVRRLHDQNLSGWFYLLGFIPYVGWLIMLVFMLIPGNQGENRFGPDPKGDNAGTGVDNLESVFR